MPLKPILLIYILIVLNAKSFAQETLENPVHHQDSTYNPFGQVTQNDSIIQQNHWYNQQSMNQTPKRKIINAPDLQNPGEKIGTVVVLVFVNASGNVVQCKIDFSRSTIGNSEYFERAVEYAKQLEFESTDDNKPSEWISVPVEFNLR